MSATPFRQYAPWYAGRLGWYVHALKPAGKEPVSGCEKCRRGDPDRPNPNYVEHAWRQCPCLQRRGSTCHGLWSATNDPQVIADLARRYPNANIGVNLGKSCKLIIDLDDHNHGDVPAQPLPGIDVHPDRVAAVKDGGDAFALLCGVRNQPWPDTLTLETPSGHHLVFDVPDGFRYKPSASALGWQIDVKAGPAYGVMAGSVTDKGEYKVMVRTAPATLPVWLAEELERTGHVRQPPVRPQRDPNWQPPKLAGGKAYVSKAVAAELEAVASCPPGRRNEQLCESAFALGQFVGAGLLDAGAVHQAITSAAEAAGVSPHEPKAQDTIRRGIDAGSRSPRTIPETRPR